MSQETEKRTYQVRFQRIYECIAEVEAVSPEDAEMIVKDPDYDGGFSQEFLENDYYEVEEV